MKNYTEMTDFEINCAVARAMGFEDIIFFDVDSSVCRGPVWNVASGVTDDGIRVSRGIAFTPCNSWDDAGPIIVGNAISITPCTQSFCDSGNDMFLNGDWEASCENPDKFTGETTIDENPLRAAMIVFLMMHEGK